MRKLLGTVFILFLLNILAGCAGVPPLQSAAERGDIATLKKLLNDGANINEVAQYGTVIAYASRNCHIEAVKLLLERGADVNASNSMKITAMHTAAAGGCNDVIRLLIDKGSDIDTISAAGYTPLSLAAYWGKYETIKLLLEKGADPDIAINGLIRNKANDAAQSVALVAKSFREGKTQIAVRKDIRASAIKSDIDEIPAITTEPRNNAYAVVIGIENYRSIPKSDYSRSDATLVKAYLKTLGFQERNIDLIVDEKATKTDIEKSLEAWLPNRMKKDSTVIVYFSGHGAPEPASGDAYLVPYDGDPNYLPVTGYSLKRLYENLGKLEAKEVIVVLDSCFSGAGGRSVLAKGARPLGMMASTGALSSNMVVLSATQSSQISTSSPDKGHGVFTYYFLKAIKDGKKDIAEIYEHISLQVEDEAKQLNVQQSPSISPDVKKLKDRFSLRK